MDVDYDGGKVDYDEVFQQMSQSELEGMLCEFKYSFNYSYPFEKGQVHCDYHWDTARCWPPTLAGHATVLECPDKYGDLDIESTSNASKRCLENGTWDTKADYSHCLNPNFMSENEYIHNFVQRTIYNVGFPVSIVALSLALFIFTYFKTLQCIRNRIHSHLIITFILKHTTWLVMNTSLAHLVEHQHIAFKLMCKFLVTLFNYFQVTNFFWMLVEGLYLHTMIVWAFSIEKVKFWHYAVLGWCVPALVVIPWAIVKANFEDENCWLPMVESHLQYIYLGPILLALFLNLIFLASILYVLITKLRESRHYRKAVKATFILFPLLGLTYVLLLTHPTDNALSRRVFVYFNATLQSTQGLLVAVIYCFLNGEVRATITSKFRRWREGRNVMTRYSRASIAHREMRNNNTKKTEIKSTFKSRLLKKKKPKSAKPGNQFPMLTNTEDATDVIRVNVED